MKLGERAAAWFGELLGQRLGIQLAEHLRPHSAHGRTGRMPVAAGACCSVLHYYSGATLNTMPTSRPRHTVTETDEVARALDEAARRWPSDSSARGRLILHLLQEGHRAIRGERDRDADVRREALQRTSGALTGAYPPDYLARLRDDWPE